MAIPAPLPPPTPEQVDALVASNVAEYFQQQTILNLQGFESTFTMRAVAVAWTNHDGTTGFNGINVYDPTANPMDTVACRGLIAEYGAIVIRIYEWTVNPPTLAQVTADAATQAAANDASAWAAPE